MKWFNCDYLLGAALIVLAFIPAIRPAMWWLGLLIGIILIIHTAMGQSCPMCKVIQKEG